MKHPVYEQILAEIDDELEKCVFDILLQNSGVAVTRREMILMIFDEVVQEWEDLSSNKLDRKIRKCIERLRKKDFSIVSSSGEAGYRLDLDEANMDAYIAELAARRASLTESIEHAYRAKKKLPALREYRKTLKPVTQGKLFEV